MATGITYDYLWSAYQKEKQGNQLQPLARTFYAGARAFIEGLGPSAGAETKTNASNLLDSIAESRRQKILIYVAYGKPLPQPVDDSEQELYDKIVALVKPAKAAGAGIKSANKTTLKVIKDIPEVILPSGGKAGPFRRNEMMVFDGKDSEDIDFLLGNAICERP